MSNPNQTVGDMFADAKQKTIKGFVILLGIIVYTGAVIYAEVHNINLMTKGVPEELLFWAMLGIISLGITALTLPLWIHYWTHETTHRAVAFVFYAVDMSIMFFNTFIDYSVNTSAAMPAFWEMYFTYVLPNTPIIVGLGWSILFLMDPSHREMHQVEEFKAATRRTLFNRITEAAKSSDIDAIVTATAQNLANDIVGSTLGTHRGKAALPITLNGKPTPPQLPGPEASKKFHLVTEGANAGKPPKKMITLPRTIGKNLYPMHQCPTCQKRTAFQTLDNFNLKCSECGTEMSLTPANPTPGGEEKA